jgi:hypothetical protein
MGKRSGVLVRAEASEVVVTWGKRRWEWKTPAERDRLLMQVKLFNAGVFVLLGLLVYWLYF